MARTTGPAGRSVASKLAAILDVFAEERLNLTLSEVAQRAELPISTVSRLLVEMTTAGWLERRPTDGSFQVGMRLWEVGALAPRKRSLRGAAIPYLQDPYAAVHQNVQLVVLDATDGLCIERIYGKYAVPNRTDVGGRLPLHATATGKSLLAHAPEAIRASVLEGPLERFTDATITDPARLQEVLFRVRETGIAVSRGERSRDIGAVAASIHGRDGRLLGAVGIVAHVRIDIDRLGPAVRTVALAIGRSSSFGV